MTIKTEKGFEFPESCSGENAYCVKCAPKVRDNDPFVFMNYGVCQTILRVFMDGRLTTFLECKKYIESKECPAIKMVAEEKKAGKVLYWQDRNPAKLGTKTIVEQATTPEEKEKAESILDTFRRIWARGDMGDSIHDRANFKQMNGFPPDDGSFDAYVEDKWGNKMRRVYGGPPRKTTIESPHRTSAADDLETPIELPPAATIPVDDGYAAVISKMAKEAAQ